jgi:DNA-binding transcriptional MerR regulator
MLLRIQDAARELGVSPAWIRSVERAGVLKIARDRVGHRRLSDDDLELLKRVLMGRAERRRVTVDDTDTVVRAWARRHGIDWPDPDEGLPT